MTTIKELISKPEKYNPDLDVHIRDEGTNHNLSVYRWVGNKEYVTIGVD